MTLTVLVTGASGYLGSAIAARLARAGHRVAGLTRSHAHAARLERLGVRPLLGDLVEPSPWLAEVKNADAVVHAAIGDDAVAELDRRALEAIRAGAVDGRVRHLLYMSGIYVHGDTAGRVIDETAPLAPAETVRWRPTHETAALALADHDVRVTVLRPGMVYGEARGAFGAWFREARDRGTITYPGGDQHWPTVHRDDVAQAFVLALEKSAGGEPYLVVDGSRFTVRELAEAAGRAAGATPRARSAAEIHRAGRPDEIAALLDQQMTAARVRRALGWVPRHASFVAEVDEIFREWQAAEQAAVP